MYKRRLFAVSFITLFILGVFNVYAVEYPNPDVLATAEYIAARIGDPNVVLLDVRKFDAYKKEHIPGAINLGGEARKILRDPTSRAYTWISEIERILGDAGINMNKEVIIYGAEEKNPYYFTVAFWILEYLGHQNVKFYPGGITEWKALGYEVRSGEEKLLSTTFKASVREDRIATTQWMLENYNNPNVIVLDTRSSAEYAGKDCRALRCGHIPGAINIDTKKTLYNTTTWKLLPLEELLKNYGNLPKDKEIVLHCQTGTRTTYTYFVLRLLGYEKIRNYDDSWRVWGSRMDTPIEGEQWYNFASLNKKVKKIPAIEKLSAEALTETVAVKEEVRAVGEEAKMAMEAAEKASKEAAKAQEAGVSAAQDAKSTADQALSIAAQKAGRTSVFGAYLLAIAGIIVALVRRK
jgi:thiosulfate/3-mercaptopyruvate sulfurtransferase